MLEAIKTFWETFLTGDVYSSLITCLIAVTLVFVLYGCIVRPMICIFTRKNDKLSLLPVFDKVLAIILVLFCLFTFSPNFLNFKGEGQTLPVESTFSSSIEAVTQID